MRVKGRGAARAIGIAAVFSVGFLAGCDVADDRSRTQRSSDASAGAQSVAGAEPWRAMRAADRPFDGGAPSAEALVHGALAAIETRDTTTLAGLLVDRDEFIDIIYPELWMHYAAARDTRSETKAFLWENQSLNARKGLFKALREVGGARLELVSLRFADGAKPFRSYTLHEGTEVDVRTADGATATLLALGSIVERNGRYKLMSYRDID